MAQSTYSHQELYLETVFEDTQNVCVLSRVQLRDYNSNQFHHEEAYKEKETADFVNDKIVNNTTIEYDSEPEIPFEGEYQDDAEVMKSMGLPVNFGNKAKQKYRKNAKKWSSYEFEPEADIPFNEEESYYTMPDSFIEEQVEDEMNTDWELYWKLHGEEIVMNSWIQKYKNFINPDYFQQENLELIHSNQSVNNESLQTCATAQYDKKTENQTTNIANGDINNGDGQASNSLLVNQMNNKFQVINLNEGNKNSNIPQDVSTDMETKEEMECDVDDFNSPDLDFMNDLKDQKYFNAPEKLHDFLSDMTFKKPEYNNMFVCKLPLKDEPLPCMPSTDDAWDELWMQHSQDEHDYHYNIFKDTYSSRIGQQEQIETLEESKEDDTVIELVKCSTCGRSNCYLCCAQDIGECALQFEDLNINNEDDMAHICPTSYINGLSTSMDNGFLKVEVNSILENDIFDNNLPVCDDSHVSEIFSSSGDSFKSAEDNSDMEKIDVSDDDPPSEIPTTVKRSLSSDENETEAPLDYVTDLGFVIKPSPLRIDKKPKSNKCSKRRKKKKCPFKMIISSNEEKTESTTDSGAISNEKTLIVPSSSEECNPKSNPAFQKYWSQRYRLFQLFDEGIQLDDESWFSVTPEKIASHISERCTCDVIVDAFCGAGGNSIQFAMNCFHVIAIDIDPKKIELAKNNAKVYGVEKYIDFIVGNYFDIAPTLKADVVFLSPPWGGPQYLQNKEFDISQIEPDIYKTFEVSSKITKNIALFVPRTTIVNQLVQLAGDGNFVEIEQNALNKKVKTITAYYGDLVQTGNDES